MSNYIGQCAQLCTFYILQLSDDVGTTINFQKVLSEIVRWRLNTSLYDMWSAVGFADFQIPAVMSWRSLTAHSCVYWMNELTKIDERLSAYFSAVALLHVGHKISRNCFNSELMDILSTVLGYNFNQCCSILSQCKTELNTSELVELLQKSAVEHITTYRQLMASEFGCVATIVTTDYEALYAYKRGDYQQCLQLSTQNVHTLMSCAVYRPIEVPTLPEFIQLMDDDIVSLTALTLIVNPESRDKRDDCFISQVTLSLYLMTQCQLKLRHSVTSLAKTFDYIKVAQRGIPRWRTLEQLTLKLTERKVHRISSSQFDCRRS